MAKKKNKRRTQVKDLPQKEKQLSKAEQQKVKGGIRDGTSNTLSVAENVSMGTRAGGEVTPLPDR